MLPIIICVITKDHDNKIMRLEEFMTTHYKN